MNNNSKKIKYLLFIAALLVSGMYSYADIAPEYKEKEGNELQRKIYSFYDVQRNSVSNIEFAITNTGKVFYDDSKPVGSQGTGIWPRGSQNYYVFGGGVWIGAQKKKLTLDSLGNTMDSAYTQEIVRFDRDNPIRDGEGNIVGYNVITEQIERTAKMFTYQTIMALTYNPYNGMSMMVPGRIDDGYATVATDPQKYRVFFSQDYSSGDGTPFLEESSPIWPIWDTSNDPADSLKYDRYFGYYVYDENMRNTNKYPRGPAFISGEDIFCTYKDTDISRYNFFGGATTLTAKGYPLRIQYEQMVYSWGFGDYKDFIFIKYEQHNTSPDTLWNMWLSPVFDVDIALSYQAAFGAGNDKCSFYGMEGKQAPEPADPDKAKKNFAYQWSDPDRGEGGRGFGYVGFVFLESPAVIHEYVDRNEFTGEEIKIMTDSVGFVRKDKKFYDTEDQLGLVTYRNWSLGNDPREDTEMYDFISARWKDGDTGPGDKRYMMATGPFHLRPGDSSRTVVGLGIAPTGLGGDATGEDPDLTALVALIDFMQSVYDNNFRAPQPPLKTNITDWIPLNNGMMIKWDEASEMSIDRYEGGLAFMGYRIYRARRTDLDTFTVSSIDPNSQYPSGTGPLGWKMVEEYSLPTPFVKSAIPEYGPRTVVNPARPRAGERYMGIDSMMVVGPVWVTADSLDISAIRVMRIPRGVNMYNPLDIATGQNVPATLVKLHNSGFYQDAAFGNRIVPVINSIDTAAYSHRPWGQFFTKITKQHGIDFSQSAMYYKGQHNYLLDSVMLGVVHLNQSLAKINPLFYSNQKIVISESHYAKLVADTLNKGEVWITKADSVLDSTTGKWLPTTTRIEIDSMYKLNTYALTTLANGNQVYTIDVVVLNRNADTTKKFDKMLMSMEHFQMVRDSLYSYILKGWARKIDFPDFANSAIVKEEVIKPYMKEITNNRTFVDIGDDYGPDGLRDALVTPSDDIGKTERLFNNVPYYYKVLSFDEGDYLQPTPVKLNEGLPGLPNFAETYPSAERASRKLEFSVIDIDKDKIGGLYDFNLFAIDPQRASQIFAGDTLELEFEVYPRLETPNLVEQRGGKDTTVPVPIGLYYVTGEIVNVSKNREPVFSSTFPLSPKNCDNSWNELYTEFTASRAQFLGCTDDLVTGGKNCYGEYTNDSIVTINSLVTTGDFTIKNYCYAYGYRPEGYGTLGLSFRTTLQQYGGIYRPYSAEKINSNASTFLSPIALAAAGYEGSNDMILTTRHVGYEILMKGIADGAPRDWSYMTKPNVYEPISYYREVYGRFNNGPGIYEVEFLPGGEEDLTLTWGPGVNEKTIKVKYLIPKITNVLSYNRPAPELSGVDSVAVTYNNGNVEPIILPLQPNPLPVLIKGFSYKVMPLPFPMNLPIEGRKAEEMIGKFNLYAECYINCRNTSQLTAASRAAQDVKILEYYNLDKGIYTLGTQNRYYISMISDENDTLDFVHTFNISGAQFVADYLGKGRRFAQNAPWTQYTTEAPFTPTWGEDFKAGDKIRFTTHGGALGFPLSGAKVRFAVSETKPDSYTDELLDEIKIVPNPYVITHQGQSSPYAAKLFFTKLPAKCSIKIYTVSGDLVDTIEHDEILTSSDGKYGVDIWNLLTKNGQRIQSQTLVALIETPDGAKTLKQFSVVLGGFRVMD